MKVYWFYIPNLICYFRLFLVGYAIFTEELSLKIAALALSCILDYVDGLAARFFNQQSFLGSRLDLIADALTLLSMGYYAYTHSSMVWLKGLLLFSMSNDLVHYWVILFAFYRKETKVDHKKELRQNSFLARLYLNQPGLAISNILSDVFLLLCIYTPPATSSSVILLCFLGFLFRQTCLIDLMPRILRVSKLQL